MSIRTRAARFFTPRSFTTHCVYVTGSLLSDLDLLCLLVRMSICLSWTGEKLSLCM
jgi:hypothetical protein